MRSDIAVDKEIAVEACAWFAQLETGDLSAADLAALREWMARSPAHARELREIAQLSGQLSVLTELAGPLATAAGATSTLRKRNQRLWMTKPALALTLVLCVGAAIGISVFRSDETSPAIYRTDIGEYRSVELADGSKVKLNTKSLVEVRYDGHERRVRLVYGEALFDVAKNERIPFRVYSGDSVAEAVGTSFVVRLNGGATQLAVVEGLVAFSKVARDEHAGSAATQDSSAALPLDGRITRTQRVLVKAGQGLSSSDIAPSANETVPQMLASPMSEREIQRKLSWTEGLLDFSQSSLEDVVAEVSRHNRVSIVIADPDLKSLTFGGTFRTGDVDHLLEALERLGVRVERRDHDEIVLHRAASE